jgi:hypothetical protein
VTVWAVHKCYIEWSLCRSYHITMSLGTEALSHSIWKQYQSNGTPKSIDLDPLGGKPTILIWQLFGRNLLRPHVLTSACSPSTGPKVKTCYNTSHIRPDNLEPTPFFTIHRRTITITRRDPMCFLRRFLLGDRRRNQPHYLYLSLEHSAACSFVSAFYLLIWSLRRSRFLIFFVLDIQMLSLIAVHLLSSFFTRGGEVRSIMAKYVDVAFATRFCLSYPGD